MTRRRSLGAKSERIVPAVVRLDVEDEVLKLDEVALDVRDGLRVAEVRISNTEFGGELKARVLLDPVDDRTAVVPGSGDVLRVVGVPSHEKLFYSGYAFTCYHRP
jgi:hypothetical protein